MYILLSYKIIQRNFLQTELMTYFVTVAHSVLFCSIVECTDDGRLRLYLLQQEEKLLNKKIPKLKI